jgi:16S rRNA (guanine527-N7)-methyltransferase
MKATETIKATEGANAMKATETVGFALQQNFNETAEMIARAFEDFAVTCEQKQIEKLALYMEQVLERNQHLNLTSITDRSAFIIKHLLDSIACYKWSEISAAESIIDVGTGAGFPGVPLAILFPDKEFTLVDSLNKRVNAISEFIENIDISNAKTMHGRAEDLAHLPYLREQFDLCLVRAVSEMSVLAEYCLPFIRPGGWLYAYKGESISQEADRAKRALKILGGRAADIRKSGLDKYGLNHNIVVIEKTKATPAEYPRQAGKPVKSPLS